MTMRGAFHKQSLQFAPPPPLKNILKNSGHCLVICNYVENNRFRDIFVESREFAQSAT